MAAHGGRARSDIRSLGNGSAGAARRHRASGDDHGAFGDQSPGGSSRPSPFSFNLGDGESLGNAVNAIHAAQARIGMPSSVHSSFVGTAQAFNDSLMSEPLLIAAAVVTVYIVLGILYESYIHPRHDIVDVALRRESALASSRAPRLAEWISTSSRSSGSSFSSGSSRRTPS